MIRSLKTAELILAAIAAALLMLVIGVLSGVGHSVDWLDVRAPQANAAPRLTPRVPVATLASLSNTWQTPLFSTDRSPDVMQHRAQQTASLAGLTLTGVILDGDMQVAFIRQADGPPLKIHRGEQLPDGWTLESLTPLHARFTLDGHSELLSLPLLKLPPPSTEPPISLSDEAAP